MGFCLKAVFVIILSCCPDIMNDTQRSIIQQQLLWQLPNAQMIASSSSGGSDSKQHWNNMFAIQNISSSNSTQLWIQIRARRRVVQTCIMRTIGRCLEIWLLWVHWFITGDGSDGSTDAGGSGSDKLEGSDGLVWSLVFIFVETFLILLKSKQIIFTDLASPLWPSNTRMHAVHWQCYNKIVLRWV